METPAPTDAPAGRKLDPKNSWHQVPDGYAKRYPQPTPEPAATSETGWGVPGE